MKQQVIGMVFAYYQISIYVVDFIFIYMVHSMRRT